MILYGFRANGRLTSAYATPLLAAMMKPVHDIDTEGGAEPVRMDMLVFQTDGLRFSVNQSMLPSVPYLSAPVPPQARIAWAILCARSCCYLNPDFLLWSDNWLTRRDRTRTTAMQALTARPLPVCDRAYVAHWAKMSAAFPDEPTLPAQTCALIAAHLFPSGTFDFQSRAEAAMALVTT